MRRVGNIGEGTVQREEALPSSFNGIPGHIDITDSGTIVEGIDGEEDTLALFVSFNIFQENSVGPDGEPEKDFFDSEAASPNTELPSKPILADAEILRVRQRRNEHLRFSGP